MITVSTVRFSDNRRIVLYRDDSSATLSFPDFDGANIDVDVTHAEADVTIADWRSKGFKIEIEYFSDAHFDDTRTV